MKTLARLIQHAFLALATVLLVAACGGGDATPPPETEPPTVNVATNAMGTATGDVIFIFTFSEDVGGSFTAGDVTVTNGTPGAFSKIGPVQYTLVVTPPANASGNITVSIAAGSFADLNGNVNANGVTATQPFSTLALAVSIASSAAGTTATGNVTFTFSFTKDVGTSFTADDVTVTGGTKGTFTMSTGTSATLVVVPPANATGTIEVNVPAGSFTDSTGIANIDAASAEQAFDTTGGVVPPPVGTGTLLLSFDEDPPAFSDMGAFGGALPSVEAGPAGGTGKALKILKPAGPDTWGGVYFTTARVPFTADRKKLTARVNATVAGAVIMLKVEVPGGASVEVAGTATGAANTWSTVTWDFAAANPALSYTVMAITPDVARVTDGQSYFIDEITLAPAETTPPPSGGSTLLLSFDEDPPAFSDMGAFGGALPTVEAGPAGGSGKALKILKPAGPDTWGGVYFTSARIPFTADRKKLTARVSATRAGAVIMLKVEVPGGASVEVAGTATGAANTWGTVTWDFAAADPALSYTVMAITPDVDRVTDGQAYFIDEITLAPAATTPPPSGEGTKLLSFDEDPPAFSDMGAYGGTLPSVEPGPAGGNGNALKIFKPASPDTWGGTFFTMARVPFTAERKKITARVNATRAGAVIRMKVEVPGGAAVEVAGTATGAANTWGTVSWDFSAADLAQSYTVMAITPDADRVTDGQTYFIDDITLAPAEAVVPPPPTGTAFLTFDEDPPAFSDMGAYGGAQPSVEAGPTGGNGNALKILKPAAPDTWGGVFFTTTGIPFTATAKTITAKVYSTLAGAVISFKVEVPGGAALEVLGTPTGAANTWGTVTWNFSAADLNQPYKIIAITPDAARVTDGQAYFIDDITVVESGGGGGGTTPPGGDMGSGGPQTLTVATGDVKTGDGGNTMFVAGEGLFAVNYVGSAEATPPFNLAAWPNAKTANFAGITGISGGDIGYFQDDVNLSNSSQKVDEGGWVSGTSLAPLGVPNFFRYFVLKGPVSNDAYMGLYLNAPNNGTVDVSSFSKIKIKVWGPAPMFEKTNFDPVLEVTLTGPKVAGCTTGSGGSEITQNLTANLKNGAGGFYTLPLSGFTVKGLCGTDTGAANVLAKLARVVVTVPGTSFNYTNLDGGNYTTGVNLGPVGFTNK